MDRRDHVSPKLPGAMQSKQFWILIVDMSIIRKLLDFIRYLQEFEMIRLSGLVIFCLPTLGQHRTGSELRKDKRGSCLVFLPSQSLSHFVSVLRWFSILDFFSRPTEH